MIDPLDDPLDIDVPTVGRTHSHRRRVHLADGSPRGRVRLDALARMLQDISDEDTTAAGFPPDEPWVVRRVDMGVVAFPAFRDTVTVETWCSGIGGRWAERRVRIVGDAGGRVEAAVLWVHLDAQGRPARLPDEFDDLYATAARGRKVRARLHHDPAPPADRPPNETIGAVGGTDTPGRDDRRVGGSELGVEVSSFGLRFTDFDVMGHVNNAVSWEPVEEALARRPDLVAPMRVSVEHPLPIDRGASPMVTAAHRDDGFDLWITDAGSTASDGDIAPACSTAQVRAWVPDQLAANSGTRV